jgi:ABC-2 type transport system permease protein
MVSLGIATAFERYYGVLKLLGGTPLSRPALLCAKLLAVVLLQIGQVGALLLAAALLFGWRPSGDPPLLLLALALGSSTFAALGLLLAGLLRAEATLAAANGLYLLLLMLGDMVVPLSALPAWVASLARLLPAAALAQALRAGFGSPEAAAFPSLAILAVWGAACLVLASRTFRWE